MVRSLLSLMFISIVAFQIKASSVLWNVVTTDKETTGYPEFVVMTDKQPFFWSAFDFSVTVSGSRATLSANPSGYTLTFAGAWIKAYFGDVVSADTMLHANSYFEHVLLGIDDAKESQLIVPIEKVNYLKFVLQDGEQCFDYQDGTRTEMPDCYYGWVSYSVGSDGTVQVLSSALDVSGNSIMVGYGPTPEPSCALLVLVGCAALVLKRKV